MTDFGGESGELVAEGVACRRGERLILHQLSFKLPAASVLVLTGANGSGKSSLLRVLATLLAPAAGQVMWAGAPVVADLARYRACLQYIGHLDAVKAALGVRETLMFWTGLGDWRGMQVDAALAAFALDGLADWPCRWLSVGQRRRLALARLIAAPAPLWLLDEPLASLDAEGEQCLVSAIETHRAAGGSAVIATHQPLGLRDVRLLSVEEFGCGPVDMMADLSVPF
jgi:heme exporter protein A